MRNALLLLAFLGIGCASPNTSGVIPGDPLKSDPQRINEYIHLMNTGEAPHLRAWIREADKTIRANNEVYGHAVNTEEDQPWLQRTWHSFSGIFTAK